MNTSKLLVYLPAFVFLLTFTGCEKEGGEVGPEKPEDQEIDASDVERGEAKAVIDGEVLSALEAKAIHSEEEFTFSLIFPGSAALAISIDSLEEGRFSLSPNSDFNLAMYFIKGSGSQPLTYTTQAGEGSGGMFEVTDIDTDAQTVSGIFHLVLYSTASKESVEISSAAFRAVPYEVEKVEEQPFTAVVNGAPWVAETMMANSFSNPDPEQPGVMNIQGSREIGVDISFTIPADVTPGTYSLVGGDYSATIYPAGESASSFFASEGEITILSHDPEEKIMEAEFHFTATAAGHEETFVVEDGKFRLDGYTVY